VQNIFFFTFKKCYSDIDEEHKINKPFASKMHRCVWIWASH